MGSESPAPLVEPKNAERRHLLAVSSLLDSELRSCAPKNKGKVPKRIHKAEREKLKREHLNDLFLDLANALGNVLSLSYRSKSTEQWEGLHSVRSNSTIKGLIQSNRVPQKGKCLLLSESHYLNLETNELEEENSTLETQILELQSEIGTKVVQSKPDLNEPPPDFQQTHLPSHFQVDHPGLPTVEPALAQPPALLVVPLHPDIQTYPMLNSATRPATNQTPLSANHMLDILPRQIMAF
ncbi:Detected protein of unknown function [Hibiscus syriacus]|uniref:Iron-related transcription factor 3 bHLH domain-containing protein n=1 Tax=Hibiscus syriacus TaxID=106335 RepID=A0A6A3CQJ0_HIBSY|nr:Detected protein of unknown function [Hibiscus syriacus]